jgi:DNA-binding NarL/FixJ family response regulator
MAQVVALMDDLFFQMKLAETAKHLGVQVKVAATYDALAPLLDADAKLLIVDLNSRGEPIAAIERIRAAKNPLPIVAFLSHVQTELARLAQSAGCDEVMPRSVFTKNLSEILARAKA